VATSVIWALGTLRSQNLQWVRRQMDPAPDISRVFSTAAGMVERWKEKALLGARFAL
jgi:hypothetical protein